MMLAKICFVGDRTYYNKYRPMMKIRDDEMYNSCELIFKNTDIAISGEEIESYINFLNEEFVVDYLYVGKHFILCEGPLIVGQGEVIEL